MTNPTTLKCPKCQQNLHECVIDEVVVDECKKCGGMWFEPGELDALAPTSVEESAQSQSDFSDEMLRCPADLNPLLEATVRGVHLHTCVACNGLWLGGLSVNALLGVLPMSPPPKESESTKCAGCGKRTPTKNAAFRFESHWCEECVVAGDYPGGTGKTLAKQRAEMVLSIGKETQRLHAAKTNRDGLKTLNTPTRVGFQGMDIQFGLLRWIIRKIHD